jgi:hypothetical protein
MKKIHSNQNNFEMMFISLESEPIKDSTDLLTPENYKNQ